MEKSKVDQVLKKIERDEDWAKVLKDFSWVPPGQQMTWPLSPHWQGGQVMRWQSLKTGRVALQGGLKKKAGIAYFFIEDGPLIHPECDEEEFVSFFQAIRSQVSSPVVFHLSSIYPYQVEHEVWMRRAGWTRPLIAVACPLTYRVQIQNSDEMLGRYTSNWRHNFKRSLKSNLQFRVVDEKNLTPLEITQFLKVYSETLEAKGIGNHLSAEWLENTVQKGGGKLFFAFSGNHIYSARAVCFHQKHAFDWFAATSHEGRKNYASYFLMHFLFDHCHQNGIIDFDFGRIGPGRVESVYHFKKGVNADLIQYLGEWSYASQRWADWMHAMWKWKTRGERW